MQNVVQESKMELAEIWWIVVSFGTQIENDLVGHSFKDVLLSQADLVHRAAKVNELVFVEAFKILAEPTNEAIEDFIGCISRISVDSEQIAEFLGRFYRLLLDCLHMLGVEIF